MIELSMSGRDVLPHRDPLLLADRLVSLVPLRAGVVERLVRADEPAFLGTAVEGAVYPSCLTLESFAQACGLVWMAGRRPAGAAAAELLVFGTARGVRFHAPVYAGQTLRHLVRLEDARAGRALVAGETRVGEALVLTVGSALLLARPATSWTEG